MGGLDLSTAGEVTLDLGMLSSRIDETAESIDCLSDWAVQGQTMFPKVVDKSLATFGEGVLTSKLVIPGPIDGGGEMNWNC